MSQVRFLSQSEFHAVARTRPRGVGVLRPTTFRRRDADDADGRIRGPWDLSTGDVDRMNDTVSVAGWHTKNFMNAGGPVLFGHDAQSAPIGGMREIWSDPYALRGNIEFANHEFAETILGLIDANMMKSGSVGFIPLRWQYSTDPDRKGGINFTEQDLIEYSITPTPALPGSLLQARSLGVDTRPLGRWAEQALDLRSKVMPRSDLVELRAAAREPPRTRAERVALAAAHKRRLGELLSPADRAARAASIKRRLVRDGVLPAAPNTEYPRQEELRRKEIAATLDHLTAIGSVW